MNQKEIRLKSIGYVSSKLKNPKDFIFACKDGLDTKFKSNIVINKKFSDGLEGLKNFSHIWVIYWLNEAKRIELKTYPMHPSVFESPQVGVFASRSQYRPNHIALRLVRLLDIQKNVLEVKGLDAIDKSFVLDIKPYVPYFDLPKKIKIAKYYEK